MNERIKKFISTTGLLGAVTFIAFVNGFIRLQTPYPELGLRPYLSSDYIYSGAFPTIIAIVLFWISSLIYENISVYKLKINSNRILERIEINQNHPNINKLKLILINNTKKIYIFVMLGLSITSGIVNNNIIHFVSYLVWLLIWFYFLIE